MSVNLATKGSYRQPVVVPVAPDAVVFIEHKRTIKANYIDEKRELQTIDFDFMSYVTSIGIKKGIDSVPGQASIVLNMPLHIANQVMSTTAQVFSTMQEVEIYMKGRFQVNNTSIYYPVFWGIISNVSENTSAGNFRQVTLSCQDMMRWLQVTVVNVRPSVMDAGFYVDTNGNTETNKNSPGWASRYTDLSAMGIIRDLLQLSTSEYFVSARNISQTGSQGITRGTDDTYTVTPIDVRDINTKLTKEWEKKFLNISVALNIFGYVENRPSQNIQEIDDVTIDSDTFRLIYGIFMDKIDNGDINSLMPYGTKAAKGNTSPPPAFASELQNRLDIANEVKNQLHLEFFQDVDGTIVLKPPFYNMDTRKNPVYVIEDVDITNATLIEDESQIKTRIDVTGAYYNGSTNEELTSQYGYAIDMEKLEKYGFRLHSISTNFLTSSDSATFYAAQELVRMNSLILNGSLTIQGRPEIKLGYPIYLPGKDTFYYVTGIDHDFQFGGSFDTTLSVTAARTIQRDSAGDKLKDLGLIVDGAQSDQQNVPGKDSKINKTQPYDNVVNLCNDEKRFDVMRPNFRYKRLDDILRTQGTFRFVRNSTSEDSDFEKTITDNEGYLIIGGSVGLKYAKDLKLTEDFRIINKTTTAKDISELVSSMTIKNSTGQEQRTLRFQQPLTLDQIQNTADIATTRATSIAVNMKPTNTSNVENSKITNKNTTTPSK